MPTIESALDLRSPESRANAEIMRGLVTKFRNTAERVWLGGGQAARDRHLTRGKLLLAAAGQSISRRLKREPGSKVTRAMATRHQPSC